MSDAWDLCGWRLFRLIGVLRALCVSGCRGGRGDGGQRVGGGAEADKGDRRDRAAEAEHLRVQVQARFRGMLGVAPVFPDSLLYKARGEMTALRTKLVDLAKKTPADKDLQQKCGRVYMQIAASMFDTEEFAEGYDYLERGEDVFQALRRGAEYIMLPGGLAERVRGMSWFRRWDWRGLGIPSCSPDM
eukprot:gene3916-biopygen127